MNLRASVEYGWRRFWFGGTSATNLAALRILVAVHALWILLSRDFAGITALPDVFRSSVPPLMRVRFLLFEGNASLDGALQWITLVALLCAIVGVVPRIACFVAGLAIYHLAPLESAIWGTIPVARGLTLAPLALLLLAFSPSGDALTISRRREGAARRGWEYGWPVRLAQVLVVQIYFFAGVGKLLETGLSWASADNIRRYLLLMNQSPEVSAFTAPGLWIADHPTLCALIGIGTLVFELGSPAVLFVARLRHLFVPAALIFHAGIAVTMNVYVGEAWYVLAFVDWSWFRRSSAPPEAPDPPAAARVELPAAA